MEEIPQQMKVLLDRFDSIRGKAKSELSIPFWDLVVLTASDQAQKEAYELQLEDKVRRGQLPTGVPYIVYADPPGTRAGCGGSSMFVITQLEERFGREQLTKWRVLLLNAGGQSQRLPSASALGKIFTALPINGFQMLDLKLALYLPFLERMSPGYLHPASDCIEVYAMDPDDKWNFTEPGITALAHPSTLKIGTGHGVYVLEEQDNKEGPRRKTEFRKCLKVLQKPSIQWMRDDGAVLVDDEQNEFVYTDSLFFFDHNIGTKLGDFFRKNSPLNCEIDSYGDFLQPLGPNACIDYTLNTANVSKVEPGLVKMRQDVFHLLKGTPLHIVGLNASKFYHYGTFDEYLYHITEDKAMEAELSMNRFVNSRFTGSDSGHATNGPHESGEPAAKDLKTSSEGCIMHSLLSSGSQIPFNSIVEYCHCSVPLKLGKKCVVSNCQYTDGRLPVVSVPGSTFLHTASVNIDNKTHFVTVVFDIHDNLKKGAALQDTGSLIVMGKPMEEVLRRLSLDLKTQVFPGKSEGEKCSMWTAKMFPVAPTMTASLDAALEMISKVHGEGGSPGSNGTSGTALLSMADIIVQKNVGSMLDFRNKLCTDISNSS